MKKIVALLLLCSFLFSITTVFAADYSTMTEAELKEILDSVRNAITVNGLKAEKKTVFLNEANIQIYISDDFRIDKQYEWDEGYKLFIPIVVINDTNKDIAVVYNNSSVNGWKTEAESYIGAIPAGKKAKGEVFFDLKNTDLEEISEFEDVEFTITVYNDDDWFGEKVINETKPITIYAPTN